MSRALKNAVDFVQEVALTRRLRTVRGLNAAQRSMTGNLAQPFWSSLERLHYALAHGRGYEHAEVVELTWEEFCREWMPRLEAAGVQVGLNWGGPDVAGVAYPAAMVRDGVEDRSEFEPPAA